MRARPSLPRSPLTDTFVGTALGGGFAPISADPADDPPRPAVQPAAALADAVPATATSVVGISIGIPEPWATMLRDWRESVGDPQAHLVPPHVTLLPPTLVEAEALPDIRAHAADVIGRHPMFDMHLSGTGTFRPVSDVVFVAVAAGIAQCEQLAADLRTGPLESTLRFPYHPHVTVAQDVAADRLEYAYSGLKNFDARFRVHLATVFEQDERGQWCPVRDCRLG